MTGRFSPLALVAVVGTLVMMSPPRLPWPVALSGAAKSSAPAVSPAASPVVTRTVLALWDSRYADSPRRTPVHTLAEMPLNHLGLVVRYHDVRSGMPPREALNGVRGVLTWFTSEALPDPQAYLAWLDGVARAGLPVMVVGNLGALKNENGAVTSIDTVNRVVSRLGWQYETRWMTTTVGVRYQAPDMRLVAFERPLPKVVPPYPLTHATGSNARVLLHVEHPAHADTGADVIVVSPRGAFVAPDFAFFADRSGEREFRQWYINPFELFRQVFSADDVPKADTATLSGRRIYYSHIDGDGWRSLTQIEPYRSRYVIAARVVLDELIRTSTDLPVSVGAVAGDLDPAWTGTAESLAVARDIYAQPQVEAAIHTYSHPLEWPYYDPERRETRRMKRGEDQPDLMGPDVVRVAEGQEPRSYTMKPFNLSLEIAGAAEFVNRLLPPGKRVTLMQWPGDTRPFRKALAETRTAGLANINGGDTRFDREFPSAAWVAPLANQVDGELQVYASNSNENTYTDLWRGRFFGFGFLTRTIENTGTPRRLKPFNLYYHMYSGERLSSLNAVRANLTYARTVPIAPIETSRYSRIVEGFYHVAFEPVGRRAWRVRHRGSLQTLRFDTPLESVDFERSRGVIGQRHELGSLYVALDEAVELPLVALKPTAAGREPAERVPYLVESRWRVHSVRADGPALRFVTEGYGFGEGRWNWPHGARAEVVWRAAGGRSGRFIAEHDADGLLDVHLPPLTGERVEVSITTRAGDVTH